MACYGRYRYCGPNCSGPGAPINQLDSICRQHDLCYRRYGQKHCDRIFLSRVRPLANRRTKMGRDARFMYKVMRLKSTLF
ncbi:Parvovirus coat protein VP1-like protein [Radiobacillus deserti]|uniref:Parvovirus coat protein VP1-like protein n=1 Tax=Radiobacillus deserti TaxID=2594883 RepID=A0A516KEI0_9BACI|nr:Parvovirus coat protein VP1-like protein [Radiobacillus deserti]QDP39815.1 Parvovirus coat protein VP1-like protein [Radiobacillus deserti]